MDVAREKEGYEVELRIVVDNETKCRRLSVAAS